MVGNLYPKWLGGLAVLGGLPTMIAGIGIAYTGFSEAAMSTNMPANSLLLVWMCILGGYLWGRGNALAKDPTTYDGQHSSRLEH